MVLNVFGVRKIEPHVNTPFWAESWMLQPEITFHELFVCDFLSFPVHDSFTRHFAVHVVGLFPWDARIVCSQSLVNTVAGPCAD